MAPKGSGSKILLPQKRGFKFGDEIPKIIEVRDYLADASYNKHMPEPFKKRERVIVSANQEGVNQNCVRIKRMDTGKESVWFLQNFCKPTKKA